MRNVGDAPADVTAVLASGDKKDTRTLKLAPLETQSLDWRNALGNPAAGAEFTLSVSVGGKEVASEKYSVAPAGAKPAVAAGPAPSPRTRPAPEPVATTKLPKIAVQILLPTPKEPRTLVITRAGVVPMRPHRPTKTSEILLPGWDFAQGARAADGTIYLLERTFDEALQGALPAPLCSWNGGNEQPDTIATCTEGSSAIVLAPGDSLIWVSRLKGRTIDRVVRREGHWSRQEVAIVPPDAFLEEAWNVTIAFPSTKPKVTITHARFDGTANAAYNGLQVVTTPRAKGSYHVTANWGGHPFQYEVDLIEQGGPGLKTVKPSTGATRTSQGFAVAPPHSWMIVLKNTETGNGVTPLTATFTWP